jgi:hypothetical protein
MIRDKYFKESEQGDQSWRMVKADPSNEEVISVIDKLMK